MTTRQLIRRSLRHYWRTQLGVVLGTALAALVLTGALLVGDSVKGTLRAQAESRVGKIGDAFVTGERLVPFSADPAKRPQVIARSFVPDKQTAAVLLLHAAASRPDGAARANRVQLIGVDDAFWKLSPSTQPVALAEGETALNERLAAQLGLSVGGELLVKVEKPSLISRDAPLSGEENEVATLRLRVTRIVGDADFGRFSLQSGQVPPLTAFLPLATLQQKIGAGEKVNLFLRQATRISESKPTAESGVTMPFPAALQDDSRVADDYDLKVLELPNHTGMELRTPRVFLDPAITSAARRAEVGPPAAPAQILNPLDSLTYFVNELRAGDGSDAKAKSTPYSMVTAIDAPGSGFIAAELADDEITISEWLAEDLGVGTGGKVTVKYFVMGERRQLVEKARTFTVLQVLPMSEPQLNSSWMPDFPGLADKENCRDWKPGFDFDATRMRDKDQDYWKQYRGTPKAFVNLKIGQEMWGNRWGNLTSIRYPAGAKRQHVERIAAFIDPAALGFRTIPLREQALAATNAPVDFGQLFVSFSFFLIAAAAVLTGLLFTFSIEQRVPEAGLLLAVGWRPRAVRRLFLREGAMLALLGSVLGAALAAIYTKLVLQALAGVWSGAVGGTRFLFTPVTSTFAIGILSGVTIALLAMWLASRRIFKMEAAALLSGAGSGTDAALAQSSGVLAGGSLVALVLSAGAIGLGVFSRGNPIAFFGAGALLLTAGVLFTRSLLRGLAGGKTLATLPELGLRNIARRHGRSLATIAVLASGVFMVVAVDSFRKGAEQSGIGTGGFALVGESASPIYEYLNTAKGRDAYALDEKTLAGVRIVQARARDGDDASCLNLNRALQPRLLGVNFAELQQGFGLDWSKAAATATGAVPGVVDANTLQWAMQKKLGDTIEYLDDRGQPLKVQLVATVSGSILQGLVLIPEAQFVERFPNQGGTRYFLLDAPTARLGEVREHLSRQLADRGLELVPTATRLAEFNAVENTYLSIFQVLGGLGMLLGSAGLGIVVARNVLERRREFGLLEAVGFTPRQLRALVFAEHRWLIAGAVGIGAASALVAVWPQMAAGFPWKQVALLLSGMTLLSVFWAWMATRLSLRGSQTAALRSE